MTKRLELAEKKKNRVASSCSLTTLFFMSNSETRASREEEEEGLAAYASNRCCFTSMEKKYDLFFTRVAFTSWFSLSFFHALQTSFLSFFLSFFLRKKACKLLCYTNAKAPETSLPVAHTSTNLSWISCFRRFIFIVVVVVSLLQLWVFVDGIKIRCSPIPTIANALKSSSKLQIKNKICNNT